MNVNVLICSYLVVLFLSSLLGLYRMRKMDRGGRIIVGLITLTFIIECIAYAAALILHNSMPVYGVFNLVQLAIVGLYFNHVIDVFRARNLGVKFAVVAVVAGIVNIVFFQPLNSFNSYFLLFESIAVISFSLFFFARLMLSTSGGAILLNPHFWITAVFVFFWSATFFYWGIREYMVAVHPNQYEIIAIVLVLMNIFAYAALGCIFLLYPIFQPRQ